ncbi:MAG: hypothetical protein ETSY1_03980 [Candidatus Entotheonella factor]|uniref:Uncharacterized protein n=1 Tax=Entotheonella factor TaxID=1429438 RepID=W4LX81_ENTF1|nr:Nif11-like leader peptide family natural product precursor [Candidatus Entotheonella palauensis]ETX02341.1 MAG: hypothetical protein ETSY1_03980 [Candidatus Entotheonella factor]
MSVQAAFEWIQQLRADEALTRHILALTVPPDLEHVVQLGAQMGLMFTVDELGAAHKHDWQMRWLLHHD